MQEEDGAALTIPAVSSTLLQHPQALGAYFIPVGSFFSLIYNLNKTSAQNSTSASSPRTLSSTVVVGSRQWPPEALFC